MTLPITTPAPEGRFTFHPFSPVACLLDLNSITDLQDSLTACQATLYLLADLFVAKAKHPEILNTDSARLGMFNQLLGLAGTLEAIRARLEDLNLANPAVQTPKN